MKLSTVEAVCSAAALAIRNADMFRRESEHGARLASLLDSSRAITSTVLLDRVLPIVAEKTCNAIDAKECVIWEYLKDEDVLVERTFFSSTGVSYTPVDRIRLGEDGIQTGDPRGRRGPGAHLGSGPAAGDPLPDGEMGREDAAVGSAGLRR